MTEMSRRHALTLFAAVGGAAGLGAPVRALSGDPIYEAYQANARNDPWTLGVRDAPASGFDGEARRLHGRLPRGLSGTLYRNGPGRYSRQDWRYRHWFDGDGFLQAWQLDGNRIAHRGRFIETSKWQAEEAAGRFLTPAFGSMPPDAGGLTGPDDMNVANTSVMMLNGELLALWEGGSAWSLDADTLQARGPRRWGSGLDGVHFSAHPKVEPETGIVWNFGQDAYGERLVLWKIGADGNLIDAGLVDDIGAGMIHDFIITERSLVFLVGNLHHERLRLPFLDGFAWRDDVPMRAIAIDKNDWSQRRSWDLPPGFLFHFGGGWEERDGTIRLDAALSPNADVILEDVRDIMRGVPQAGNSRMQLVTLGPRGHFRIETPGDGLAEFPQVDPRYTGKRRQYTWHVDWTPDQARGATAIARRNVLTGAFDRYDHGPGVYVEEPLFIPASRRSAEGEGWIVHTALNAEARATELHVFDALNLSAGPQSSWRLPYACPFGFHGCWRG
ncbi:carotenoid oxygenase family protein [Marinicauda pacifica]|jgi:all-trans-8'-apo-beta-carotenal 15,15'-oxygenase|uniref:carotenoid oxygenase family protein n=1 Tax=Marinicauda pacifica TaxID=1133559 RepID=UPI0035C847FE